MTTINQNKEYKLLKYPNPFLNRTADKFDFDNPIIDPSELDRILRSEMYKKGGVGLSATQIGINARAFVMGDAYKSLTLFNPEIIEKSEEEDLLEEGCLSFPGIKLYVSRPVQMNVRFFDKDQKEYNYWVKGIDCQIFAHEMDHLNGTVFKDRVSSFKWARAKKKLKS